MFVNIEGKEFSFGHFLPAGLLVLLVRRKESVIIQKNILWHFKSLLSRVR